MALNTRLRGPLGSRLHFLIRIAGLTGLLVGGNGLLLALASQQAPYAWHDILGVLQTTIRQVLSGTDTDGIRQIAVLLMLAGGVAALLALGVELVTTMQLVAGRRSAFGGNVLVQAVLATVLLIIINVYSFQHYRRLDWTREQQFTLPAEVREQLRQLQEETTIVVYQRHKTFGQLSDKPDVYDYAAERKVVEKVKDLVEQFREFGPQFRVIVLDVEQEGYNERLKELAEQAPPLRQAIENAPENSIFFYAKKTGQEEGSLQRMSFNEFYHLDKTASQQANQNRGNLVLLNQGVEPFARRVLNMDEHRPRIGIAVIHEVLTTESPEETFTLAGLKKSLTARGFEVRDIILRKSTDLRVPDVYTYEESKFEGLDEQRKALDIEISDLETRIKRVKGIDDILRNDSLEEASKKLEQQLRGQKLTEETRLAFREQLQTTLTILQMGLKQDTAEREEIIKQMTGFNRDKFAEQRRITDLKAKLDRVLAECDLLFIPRTTLINLNLGYSVPNRYHRLDDIQVAAMRDFIKAGKPVLACFGPSNEPESQAMRLNEFGPSGPDGVERLLNELGIQFGRQTVLFNAESRSLAEQRVMLLGRANVQVPAVDFESKPLSLWLPGHLGRREVAVGKPNPIGAAMRIAAHSTGKELNLHLRHPRPVYYEGRSSALVPEFLFTSSDCWNEDDPFPARERSYIPRPGLAKDDDPAKGTLDEKRSGPFPIGVAIETTLPARWYSGKEEASPTVRVVAIGHGHLFNGLELSPAKEQMLLNTCNWLLGRDDRLPQQGSTWSFPRVELTQREQSLWYWGMFLSLPFLFVFLGVAVFLIRRLR